MIPGRGADERLQDQALDIDQRRDVLGILAGQVGQQPMKVEVHIALKPRHDILATSSDLSRLDFRG